MTPRLDVVTDAGQEERDMLAGLAVDELSEHPVDSTKMRTANPRAYAPALLEACERALTALNTAPRFKVPALDTGTEKMDSYKIASLLTRVIALVKGEE